MMHECHCCYGDAPIRLMEHDPWEGRLDGYCDDCALARCDATPGACRAGAVEPQPPGFAPKCDPCGTPLEAPGALAFSPPWDPGFPDLTQKYHICLACWFSRVLPVLVRTSS